MVVSDRESLPNARAVFLRRRYVGGSDGDHSEASQDEVTHRLWLPPGEWFDVAHGSSLVGDRWYEASYSLEETPLFTRAGAIIPELSIGRASELNLRKWMF